MLNKIKKDFQLEEYKKTIGNKTKIHKVSLYFKEFDKLDKSKVLLVDFEFSKNLNIYEITIITIQNNKIVDSWFEEFKIPSDDMLWDFKLEKNVFPSKEFNKNRSEFTDEVKKKLINILNSSDYIVCHNYVAELRCIHSILYPYRKYEAENLELFNTDKIICTNFTFNNKYFQKYNFPKFTNSSVSEFLGWNINKEGDYFRLNNKNINIDFKLKMSESFLLNGKGEIHNSYYDTLITLTNFLSLKYIIK